MRRFCVSLAALCLAWFCSLAGLHGQQPDGPLVKKLQVPAAYAKEIAATVGLRYRERPEVTISPDAQNAQLIVLAPADAHEQIASDVQQLVTAHRQEAGPGENEPLKVQLSAISWRQFERNLRQVAGGRLPVTTSRNGRRASFQLNAPTIGATTVEVDRQSNTVTVVAAELKRGGWQKLIGLLDQQSGPRQRVTQVVRLDQAEPAPVQRAVRLLRELEPAPRPTAPAAEPRLGQAPLQPAAFQAPANQAPANQAPANQDANNQDDPQQQRPDAVVVPGDEEVRQALQDAADDEAGAGVIGDTEIQFVPELGVIIIRGAERDVQRVREVIEEIERQSEITRPEVQIRQLEHANSNAVAELLEQLYEDVLSARQGEVSITSLDAPNALLLIGREEALAGVLELIQKIDQPIEDDDRLRVFRLQHASALDAEETIRNFFTAEPGADEEPRPGLGVRVRVVADYRTNSLIVHASPRDMKEVIRLINRLDVREISAENEIKVFPLNNALAEDLAPTLREAITGEGEGELPENVTRPSTSLSIVSLDAEAGRVLESGILAGATITADDNANSIVVRAPAPSMPLIGELIRQLDKSPEIDSLVKVFTIENGDAAQLTTALQELFGDEAATGGTNVGAGNVAALAPATAADSSLVPLRFSTDVRTNSIIASGSAQDLDVVESILLRLDSEGFAERITEVIWLEHQIAENVSAAIQQYVQQRVQTVNTIQQYQQGLGPFDLPDRDLIVVAEPQSNSLLLSVAPRLYEDVRRLIDNLDRRPPMVMIKVVLAEVELGDRFEIGGELGLQDSLLFNRGITSEAFQNQYPPSDPGFNFNDAGLPNENSYGQGSLASRGISTFGVGTSSAAIDGVGGFVLSAASESVSLLFRTLQSADRLQVISRPQVMTMDNTEALVQVGQTIARPSSVNVTQNTTTIGVEDEDVGLILRVTPRVGADGLIVMDIDATRSNVNNTAPGQAIGVFDDGSPVVVPPIDITTAQSTITAYSGQTVIFGGLIQKQRENISRRVPYLADIPLLGYMFKFDQEVERRSELLVVMTPMLITGEQDLQYVKEVESSRMSWCLADVVEAHGDVGLSGGYGLWGPAVGPTIYPDLQPTVDDILMHEHGPLPGEHGPLPGEHGPLPGEHGPLPGESPMPHGPSAGPHRHGHAPAPGGETIIEGEPPMIQSYPEPARADQPTQVLPEPREPAAGRPVPQPPAPRGYRSGTYPDAPQSRQPFHSPGSATPAPPGGESPGRPGPSGPSGRQSSPSDFGPGTDFGPGAGPPERAVPERAPRQGMLNGPRQGMLNGPRGDAHVTAATPQRPTPTAGAVRQSSYSTTMPPTAADRSPGHRSPGRAAASPVRNAAGARPAGERAESARPTARWRAAGPAATSSGGDARRPTSLPSVSPQSWIR